MKIDFITACYGQYDDIRTPPMIPMVREWLLVSDEPIDAPGYRNIVERRPHVHSNVAAKIPKFLPHLYSDADVTIWVDASATIQPTLYGTVLHALAECDWTMFPHPCRDDIGEEVLASRGLPKYDDLPLEEQTAFYYRMGYQPNSGLWATGVIGRRNTEYNAAFGEAWLREVVRWGFQDQLSFAWLQGMWKLPFSNLGPDLWLSPHIHFGGHRG